MMAVEDNDTSIVEYAIRDGSISSSNNRILSLVDVKVDASLAEKLNAMSISQRELISNKMHGININQKYPNRTEEASKLMRKEAFLNLNKELKKMRPNKCGCCI